jgi:predicted metal-binding membrane protein
MPASSTSAPAEWIAHRERAVVLVSLAVTVALAWAWLLTRAGMDIGGGGLGGWAVMSGMGGGSGRSSGSAGMAAAGGGTGGPAGMAGMGGSAVSEVSSSAFAVIFAMWAVMMIAMMLPTTAPAILLFAALSRSNASTATFPAIATFAAGYMLVWTAFSAVATVAHLTLRQAALMSPALQSTSALLAALLLIAAGVYQFTPLKAACLRHCHSPIEFFTRHWRSGVTEGLRLGVLHGGYCGLLLGADGVALRRRRDELMVGRDACHLHPD